MKRNYWPLFFIGIFSFVFSMIIWTIYSASQVPINKDETFLTSYHDLDTNYNKIILSNKVFENKYDLSIKINEKDFGLVFKDMFLGQRVIEKKSNHKDIFKFGENKVLVTIVDKKTKEVIKNSEIKIRVSKPTNHEQTMDFVKKDFKNENGKEILDFKLPLKGNWNITGQFIVGNDIGYFYIKSNAI